MLILSFCNVYSQTEKQVKDIVKDYDMVKANQLFQDVKQREIREKAEVEEYAKNNNLPIYRENKSGGFDQLMRVVDGIPLYYSIDNAEAAISTRVPYLRTGGGLGLNLTGTGMVPRVWDGGPIHNHQEYAGRITLVDGTIRTSNSFHAIHVTGTILATGINAAAKGMAPAATARTFDWTNDQSEVITEATNGMLLSNHSYGTPITNPTTGVNLPAWYMGAYSQDAYDWDVIAYTFPNYLPVMSAGNDGSNNGNATPTTAGYDKLNGNKNSKNILTVANARDGAVDASGNLTVVSGAIHSSSSQGPTDDNRIKPDVTGDGAGTGSGIFSTGNGAGTGGTTTQYSTMLGTSMAAPNVTGTLTLLQEHYNNVNSNFMRASTLKGLACHTATDKGRVGPDAQYGWGYLDAKKSAEAITGNGLTSWISEETLSQGQTITMQFVATGAGTPLLGSICWTDVADQAKINNGVVNEAIADLTNDLDIRITQAANTYYPWKLMPLATANATRAGDNAVDNVERINIDAPVAGTVYTVSVTHKGNLVNGPQKFSLIVTGVTSNFTFKTLSNTLVKCSNTGNAVYNFSVNKIGGADVNFTAQNVPANANLVFSQSTFSSNGTFDVTISNLANVAAGSYVIDIVGNNGVETETKKLYLTVFHPTFSTPTLLTPANGYNGSTTIEILTWQNDLNATNWDVEVSTAQNFSTIAFSGNVTTPTFSVFGLASNTTYYWRIKPNNGCASGTFSSERSFRTAIIDCSSSSFTATNFTNATIANVVNSVATVPVTVTGGLTIGKITATINLTHTYVQDMTITLTGPASIGSPVIILQKEACGGQPDINCTYDDLGGAPDCSVTSPAISGLIKPTNLLHNLDGLSADGTWLLTVNDPYNGDGGTINSFSLKICNKQVSLSSESMVSNENLNVFTENEKLNIISSEEMESINIFDILGRNIYKKENINDKSFAISSLVNQTQALILKIKLANGQTIEKKVMF